MADRQDVQDLDAQTETDLRPRIAVTLGDPNGVGPEVILRALTEPELYNSLQPVVVGSRSVLQRHAEVLDLDRLLFLPFDGEYFGQKPDTIRVLEAREYSVFKVHFGELGADAGDLAFRAVRKATDLCLEQQVDAIVTAPLSKKAVSMSGNSFRGHTEYISRRAGSTSCIMMMVSEHLTVGLVTSHISLSRVSDSISVDGISQKLDDLSAALTDDFGIESPSIAVLGLNPHSGEGGVLGHEELEVIVPAIQGSRSKGLIVDGPFPADGFFGTAAYKAYDAVLAMYHDQGLIPFKSVAFDSGVNFTAGLTIVRTSPVHGTAFDLAGKGQASSGSMRNALALAAEIAKRRNIVMA